MNSDQWRDGFDAWKDCNPYDDERVCERCLGALTRRSIRHGWHCEECSPRDPDAEMEAARERREERQHEEDEA